MRIAIVTESFLPSRNGVTTSVCRITEELTARGHEVEIIGPGPTAGSYAGARVHSLPTLRVRQFPTALPTPHVDRLLGDFGPDVVHLASPFAVGRRGVRACTRLRLPCVAVYQTDIPAYLRHHAPGVVGRSAERAAWHWVRGIHDQVDRTLAPSTAAVEALGRAGIERVHLWRRGVDTTLFTPVRRAGIGARTLRERLAARGEVVVGYVGRLAPEKEVERLAEVVGLRGVTVLVVGDGPSRAHLERRLLGAHLVGFRDGDDLADAYAACDVFVHTGTAETFGQTLQEAAATGVPVVAPASGGPLDLVRPGITGFLYDPHRPGALRDQVLRLVAEPALRRRLGAAGRLEVEGRSWGALTKELFGHYAAVRGVGAPV